MRPEVKERSERGARDGRWAEVVCAVLLVLMALNLLAVVRRKSLTIDETVMIPAGFYHLKEGDYRPINEHPPFAKVIAAAPLVALGAEAPPIDPNAEQDTTTSSASSTCSGRATRSSTRRSSSGRACPRWR